MATNIGQAYVSIIPSMKGVTNALLKGFNIDYLSAAVSKGVTAGLKSALNGMTVQMEKTVKSGLQPAMESLKHDMTESGLLLPKGITQGLSDVGNKVATELKFGFNDAGIDEKIKHELDGIDAKLSSELNDGLRKANVDSEIEDDVEDGVERANAGRELVQSVDKSNLDDTLGRKLTKGTKEKMNWSEFATGLQSAISLGMQAFQKVGQFFDFTDGISKTETRLKGLTSNEQEFEDLQKKVRKTADELGIPYSQLGTSVSKLGMLASEAFGGSAEKALEFSATLQKGFTISGAGADEAGAATKQLTQALASGVLRGDEFNSMMENAPYLAQQMAKGLGVGTGELRKMAGEGKLTSETVIKSLDSMSGEINKEFEGIPMTFDRVTAKLQTIVETQFTDIAMGISEILGSPQVQQGLQFLSDGFANLKDAFASAVNELQPAFTSLIDVIQNTVMPYLQIAFDFLKPIFTQVMGVIGDVVFVIFNKFVPAVSKLFDAIKPIIKFVLDTLQPVIKGYLDWLGKHLNNVIGVVTGVINTITSVINTVMKAFQGDWQGAWEGLVSIFTNVWDGISKNVWKIGENIVKGIWDGISNMANWLWEQVSGFFGGLLDGIMDFLGIHSPSTVFAGIGDNLVAGLAEGINDSTKDAVRAVSNVANAMIKEAGTFDSMRASLGLDVTAGSFVGGIVDAGHAQLVNPPSFAGMELRDEYVNGIAQRNVTYVNYANPALTAEQELRNALMKSAILAGV